MTRLLQVLRILLAAAVVFASGGAATPSAHAAPPPICPPGRKVIFLHGIFTTDVGSAFDYVRHLLHECDVLEFSYDGTYGAGPGRKATYADGTPTQDPDTSASALQHLIDAYPNDEFDLVGYSMGGFIATYWVAARATPADLRRIHSVVTVDSPLKGHALLAPWEQWVVDTVPAAGALGRLPVVLGRESDAVRLVGSETTRKANVVTVRSRHDKVVSDDSATLDGVWHDEHFDGGYGTCGWQPYMDLWWSLPGWMIDHKYRWQCLLESHGVPLTAPQTALAIRKAITEAHPGYVDKGGLTSARALAQKVFAESVAAMRALPAVQLRGRVDTPLFVGGTGRLALRFPSGMEGEGEAGGVPWSIGQAEGRRRLRVNGWSVPEWAAGNDVAHGWNAFLDAMLLLDGWTLTVDGDHYALTSALRQDVTSSLRRELGVPLPGDPTGRAVILVDPGRRTWDAISLSFQWPLVSTSVAGMPIQIGPGASAEIVFGERPLAVTRPVGGQPVTAVQQLASRLGLPAPGGPSTGRDTDAEGVARRQLAESGIELSLARLRSVPGVGAAAGAGEGLLLTLDVRKGLVMLGEEPQRRTAVESAHRQFGDGSQEYADALRRYRVWQYETPLIGPFLRFVFPLPVT